MKKKSIKLKFEFEIIKGFGITFLVKKGTSGPCYSLLIGCFVFSVERVRPYATI